MSRLEAEAGWQGGHGACGGGDFTQPRWVLLEWIGVAL